MVKWLEEELIQATPKKTPSVNVILAGLVPLHLPAPL